MFGIVASQVYVKSHIDVFGIGPDGYNGTVSKKP